MKITRRQLRKVIEEAHGLSKDDVNYVKKVAKETEDDELKRILKFIAKSNVKVDVTQDVTKMKKESKMKITRRQLRQIIMEEASIISEQQDLIEKAPKVVQDLANLLKKNGYNARVTMIKHSEKGNIWSSRIYIEKDDEDGDGWDAEFMFQTGAMQKDF